MSRSETTSRFSGGKMLARRCGTPLRQGKQSVWTPTAKGGGCQTHYFFGRKPEPTYLFFAKRKGKPKETNLIISIFREVIYKGDQRSQTTQKKVLLGDRQRMESN